MAQTQANTARSLRTKSCASTQSDPYRAGIELGTALADIAPEVIFLFVSIHYDGSPELVEALFDELGRDDVVLIGTSGDGFYEKDCVAESGVSALGINSGGAITWRLDWESRVGADPFEATRRCIRRLKEDCNGPALYYLATDFRTDTSEIISALSEEANAPVVGGSAADDNAFDHCFVYVNRQVLTDHVAILAIDGPLSFDIIVAHHFQPTGRVGAITSSEATTIHEVDGVPALEFIERELGKPLYAEDEGVLTFKLTRDPDDPKHLIRSLRFREGPTGHSVQLFGGIEDCSHAQVCLAPPEQILGEIQDIAKQLKTLSFEPTAALVVSCAGRKWVLGDAIEREVSDLVQGTSSLTALAGFPSYGEFGPVKGTNGYSKTSYHNMTFILVVMGDTIPLTSPGGAP